MNRDDIDRMLNLEVDLIPSGASNRPGISIRPTYITIHNTDNGEPTADARAHARYVKGEDARARRVSWHFTVDDQRCIQHLPVDEMGWHAKQGNSRSIAIEICEHRGINMKQALDRAALLAATLMARLDINLRQIVPHKFWTGKNCPRVLLADTGGFETFIKTVDGFARRIALTENTNNIGEAPAAFTAEALARPDLLHLPEEEKAEHHSQTFLFSGTASLSASADIDRIARLERLVGMLVLENQTLRESLLNAQHGANETN